MGVEYYHLSPVILSDAIFFAVNPTAIETGTVSQRQMAYLIAEQQMMKHLSTFLVPTTVTGSYLWPVPYAPIELGYTHVQSINRLVATSFDDSCSCDVTENAGCASIRDNGQGYIDLRITAAAYRSKCGCSPGGLYQAIVTFTAGLPTGVASGDLGLHAALGMLAFMHLGEIINPGVNEGGIGAPGIQSWSADGYSETRVNSSRWMYTVFGMSARAQYIAQLVRHLKLYRAMRL